MFIPSFTPTCKNDFPGFSSPGCVFVGRFLSKESETSCHHRATNQRVGLANYQSGAQFSSEVCCDLGFPTRIKTYLKNGVTARCCVFKFEGHRHHVLFFFGCHSRWEKKLSEVDEGIRCKGKHWKHPLFFPGVDWEIISSTDSYSAQKKDRYGLEFHPKKLGFRSFFHRKKKSAWFWGKVGFRWMPWRVRKNWLGLRQVPPMVS